MTPQNKIRMKKKNKQTNKKRLHKPYLVIISIEKAFQPKLSTQPHSKNKYKFRGNY